MSHISSTCVRETYRLWERVEDFLVKQDVAYYHVVSCRFGSPEHLAEWMDWYENVHIPAILSVPGIRSVRRYAEIGEANSYLTIWEIDGPRVFDEPAYVKSRGWGPWEPYLIEWTISLLERHRPERRAEHAPRLGGS
jgi:hypothetical protein